MSEKSNEWEKCESFAIIDWKVFEIQWFLKSLVTNYNIQGVSKKNVFFLHFLIWSKQTETVLAHHPSDQVYSIYVF